MSFFHPWTQEHMELYLNLQDCGSVHLPPAEEVEEDWSDLRWGLSHLPASMARDFILKNLIEAETAAADYLDDNIPPDRPEPAWLTDEED